MPRHSVARGQEPVFVEAEVMVEGDAGRVLVAKLSKPSVFVEAKFGGRPADSSGSFSAGMIYELIFVPGSGGSWNR